MRGSWEQVMRKQDGCPSVLCEQLEGRLYLSAAPAEAHVSFLPERLGAASGYVADHGATYGDRGGGLVYGEVPRVDDARRDRRPGKERRIRGVLPVQSTAAQVEGTDFPVRRGGDGSALGQCTWAAAAALAAA